MSEHWSLGHLDIQASRHTHEWTMGGVRCVGGGGTTKYTVKVYCYLKYSTINGRKEMFYLTTHSTHFILRLYGVRTYGKGQLR